MDNEYQQRKHPCHRVVEIPGKPMLVFVTVGISDRSNPWLSDDSVHSLLRKVWKQASGWCVHRYILMPDHLHFFTFPGDRDVTLTRWITYWKEQFTKAHRTSTHRFQANYWDTTIRSGAHYEEKYSYMRYNPVRKGLVNNPDDWPFQGIIHDFIWMET